MAGSGDGFGRTSGINLGEAWRDVRRKSRLDQEVIGAVRAQAAGRTRAEIGELVGAERGRRGMRPVPEPMLDLWIDAVLDDDPLSRARTHVDAVTTLVRAGSGLVRMIRRIASEHTEQDADDHEGDGDPDADLDADTGDSDPSWSWPIGTDVEHTVLAELDPGAERHLDDTARSATARFRGLSALKVTLLPTASTRPDDVVVELDGRPVGRIAPGDAAVFRPYLRDETGRGRPILAIALAVRGRGGGGPKLYVATPKAWPGDGGTPTAPGDGA